MSVVCDEEHTVAQHRHTAIQPASRVSGQSSRLRPRISPYLASTSSIHRENGVHLGNIHYAVDDDGGDLQLVTAAHRVNPGRRQTLDIASGDLLQVRITISIQLSVVRRPFARLRMR